MPLYAFLVPVAFHVSSKLQQNKLSWVF